LKYSGMCAVSQLVYLYSGSTVTHLVGFSFPIVAFCILARLITKTVAIVHTGHDIVVWTGGYGGKRYSSISPQPSAWRPSSILPHAPRSPPAFGPNHCPPCSTHNLPLRLCDRLAPAPPPLHPGSSDSTPCPKLAQGASQFQIYPLNFN